MINREDMLELTRRMTPARTSFVRMAGCYTDSDGEYDGSFNIHFLKLSGSEKARNLAIAKKIPFAESNEKLREYRFPETSQGPGSIWQMLMALRECGLKNDALLETFYDILIEGLQIHGAYAIYMFYDRYDIPAKASDKERLGGIRGDVPLSDLRCLPAGWRIRAGKSYLWIPVPCLCGPERRSGTG